MNRPATIEPDRLTTARSALINHLDEHARTGHPAPCRTGDPLPPATWTSDDRADQDRAATACLDCHGATACRTFGLTWPDLFGTYGGLTHDQRRPSDQKASA